MVTGGIGETGALESTEIYDPESNQWTPAMAMALARSGHHAILLKDGRLLVVGGPAECEIYDPTADEWRVCGELQVARSNFALVVSGSLGIIAVGGSATDGRALSSVEHYDRGGHCWRAAANLATARYQLSACVLADGSVLAIGGNSGALRGCILSSCERLATLDSPWVPTEPLAAPRHLAWGSSILGGDLLVLGGSAEGAAERYSYDSGAWRQVAPMSISRSYFFTATQLPGGRILVCGGQGKGGHFLADVEQFDPSTEAWEPSVSLACSRVQHTATLLQDGTVLVAGGKSPGAKVTAKEVENMQFVQGGSTT